MNESDHDLLIRIDANLIAFNKQFQEHVIQDAREFAKLETSLGAAHRRMDYIGRVFTMCSGVGSFLALIGLITGILLSVRKMGWW